MQRIFLLAVVLALVPVVWGQAETPTEPAASDAPPDISGFDRDTLLALCQNLFVRVAELEQENAALKAQLVLAAGGAGDGSAGNVDGGSTVVAEGSWVVTVLSNPEPDTAPLERQIADERAKLVGMMGINARLDTARAKLTEMQSAKTKYEEGKEVKYRNTYNNRDLAEPRRQVTQLERQRQGIEMKIRDLERKIQITRTTRTITAKLDDDKPVTILARGVAAEIGATLQPGERYTVTGRGNFSDASGEIYLRAAASTGQ